MKRSIVPMIMILTLIGATLLSSCSSSGSSTTGADATPQNPIDDDSGATGNIYTVASSDISTEVSDAVNTTLELAKTEWGLDWNLDYYIVGDNKAEAQALLEGTYCARGVQQDRYTSLDQCLQFNPKEPVDDGSGTARHVGLMEYYEYGTNPGGSAARAGLAPMHVFFHSIPRGLVNKDDPDGNPAPPSDEDLATVLHEFWHAVQVETTGATSEQAVQPLMGPVWFVEGAAEYMGQSMRAKLRADGTLPEVGNSSQSFSFQNKMGNLSDTIDQEGAPCSSTTLTEITGYDHACSGYGITLGTWAIPYLLSLDGVSSDAITTTLNPAVAANGWQQAFEATAGMTLSEFETSFHAWLDSTNSAERLQILPTF